MKKAFLVTTFIGAIALNEQNKIIGFRPLGNAKETAEKFLRSKHEIIEEERELIDELKDYEVIKGDREKENFLKQNLLKVAIELKIVKNKEGFDSLFREISLELAKLQIKRAVKKDDIILHVTKAIEEIDSTINIFVERLREWYSLHFPELNKKIGDHEKFTKLILSFGNRANFVGEFKNLAEKSMGTEFSDLDIKVLQEFSARIVELYKLRKEFENYLEKLLKEIAPNLAEIAGPTLASKLIAKAGSLEKLAKMPSTTIQLIGSEKALFRFLHGRGKSPKHGLIFIHPYIQNSPVKFRGKIARALASKLSIAAKFDFFSKEYKADKLKKELEERVREILSPKNQ